MRKRGAPKANIKPSPWWKTNIVRFGIAVLVITITYQLTSGGVDGYRSTDRKLHVHILPHSHVDPGWLRTYPQYEKDEVAKILNTVLSTCLVDHPDRRFVWSEVAFFAPWFEDIPSRKQRVVSDIVASKQLEFVGGGWVQHDEALTSLDMQIDQLADGLIYLRTKFGVEPRVAWQIDPFGASSLDPYVFSQSGFDTIVLNRIPDDEKARRRAEQELEFWWSDGGAKDSAPIFTHTFYDHYESPRFLDFERRHITTIDERNVKSHARSLADLVHERSSSYRHSHFLLPFGDDFRYMNKGCQMFNNMEAIMAEINANPAEYGGIDIKFSTPSEYFDAVHADTPRSTFTTFTGDFFPYRLSFVQFWTGFYASRPNFKHRVRTSERLQRHADMALALYDKPPPSSTYEKRTSARFSYSSALPSISDKALERRAYPDLAFNSRLNLGIMAHHDAITGTMLRDVLEDYTRRLDWIDRTTRNIIGGLLTEDSSLGAISSSAVTGDEDASKHADSEREHASKHADSEREHASKHADSEREHASKQADSERTPVKILTVSNSLGWHVSEAVEHELDLRPEEVQIFADPHAEEPVEFEVFSEVHDSPHNYKCGMDDQEHAGGVSAEQVPKTHCVRGPWKIVFGVHLAPFSSKNFYVFARDRSSGGSMTAAADADSSYIEEFGTRFVHTEVFSHDVSEPVGDCDLEDTVPTRTNVCFRPLSDLSSTRLANGNVGVSFDNNGALTNILNMRAPVQLSITHSFIEYMSAINKFAGGPYVFNPEMGAAIGLSVLPIALFSIVKIILVEIGVCMIRRGSKKGTAGVCGSSRLASISPHIHACWKYVQRVWHRLKSLTKQKALLPLYNDLDVRTNARLSKLLIKIRKALEPAAVKCLVVGITGFSVGMWSGSVGMRLSLQSATYLLGVATVIGSALPLPFYFWQLSWHITSLKTRVLFMTTYVVSLVLGIGWGLFRMHYSHGVPVPSSLIDSVSISRGKFRDVITVHYDDRDISVTYAVHKWPPLPPYDYDDTEANANVDRLVHVTYNVRAMDYTNLVSRFDTSVPSGSELYTYPATGMAHRRDARQRYTGFLPGNFFPMAGHAALLDNSHSTSASTAGLHVFGRQANGVASLASGSIELMIHRNLPKNDPGGPLQLADSSRAIAEFGILVADESYTRRDISTLELHYEHPLLVVETPLHGEQASTSAVLNIPKEPIAQLRLHTPGACFHVQHLAVVPEYAAESSLRSVLDEAAPRDDVCADFKSAVSSRLKRTVKVLQVRLLALSDGVDDSVCGQASPREALEEMFSGSTVCAMPRSLTFGSPRGSNSSSSSSADISSFEVLSISPSV